MMSRVSCLVVVLLAVACAPQVSESPASVDLPPASPPAAAAETAVPSTIVVPMGKLVVTDRIRRLPSFTWDKYREYAERFAGDESKPWLSERPDLPPQARFGFNVNAAQANRSFAVVTTPTGATVWLDINADARFDETERLSLGEDFTSVELTNGEVRAPVMLRWSAQDGEGRLGVRSEHRRDGRLEVDGEPRDLRLYGAKGAFDRDGTLVIDFDRNGELDDDPLGDELFHLRDPSAYASFSDAHWRVQADEDGTVLTLTRRDDIDRARPSMTLGSPAPEFSFGEGDSRVTLSSLRGHPVLLEFFAPGCSFCIEAAPELSAAAETWGDAGVHFISIDHAGLGEDARTFAVAQGKSWPLALGEDGELARALYRVDSTPTLIVIGSDGTMLARGSWRQLAADIQSGAAFGLKQ